MAGTSLTKSHQQYAQEFMDVAETDTDLGAEIFIAYAQEIADGSHTSLDMAFTHAVRNIAATAFGGTIATDTPQGQVARNAIQRAREVKNIL